jgi:putative ABC transport system ATP-binding protein
VHPKVVVADEPTGDLDPDSSAQIIELLKRLNEQLQVTLLMVTHDTEAARVADKQFQLDHGRLVQTGGPGATPSNHPATQESAG